MLDAKAYISIWLPKKLAADCATFASTSVIFVEASLESKITVPMESPLEIIGYTIWELYLLSFYSSFHAIKR